MDVVSKFGTGRLPGTLSNAPDKHRSASLFAFGRLLERTGVVDYLRVLIIEDSLTIRAMLEELIEREEGCRVVGMASNATDARSMMVDFIPTV